MGVMYLKVSSIGFYKSKTYFFMGKEDKYKWLKQYAMPCFNSKVRSIHNLPRIKTIEEFLEGDYSKEKVRDYFFIPHNLRTLKERNYIHLVIPYEINLVQDTGLVCSVNEPFFEELPIPYCDKFFDKNDLKKANSIGILEDFCYNNILIVHFQNIVDSCKKEELKKYDCLYANSLILK